MTTKNDFPYADSPAAQMLADAIHRRQLEGISLRKTAGELGYRQAVVLSHMSTGRVPIPIERVPQFAAHLDIDEHLFLAAVLKQRFPEISWDAHMSAAPSINPSILARTLEMIAGRSLDELSSEQQQVMREVVADPLAQRRWISLHDLPMLLLLRRHLDSLSDRKTHQWMDSLLSMLNE